MPSLRQLLLPLFGPMIASTPIDERPRPRRRAPMVPNPLPPLARHQDVAPTGGGERGRLSDAALTRFARQRAAALGLERLEARLVVRWNTRLQTTAGRAWYRDNLIELNPRLGELPNAFDEIERTLLHELAHLVAHARSRGRRITAHGPEWRRACTDLGIPDESRCHTLTLGERRQVARRFAYQCPNCRQIVLRVRRFTRHSACYACCRLHNRGAYDERFRFTRITVAEAEQFLALTENGRTRHRRRADAS